MKKIILKMFVLSVATLVSSSAFAINLDATTVYSVGSVVANRTPFKPSPKVTMVTDLASGTAAATWTCSSTHLSALNKAKGRAYFMTSDDPGTYAKVQPTAFTGYASVAAAVTAGFAAEN